MPAVFAAGSEYTNRLCPATCARWEPTVKRLQAVQAPPASSAALATWAADATFRVELPQGHLPEV